MTTFSIAIRIKGEWHTIATTPDGQVVATRTKES